MRRLYVVDDDNAVRTSLHGLLTMMPEQTIGSFSGGDVFLAGAAALEPGVLLLDLHMPGTGGIEVLETLCHAHPGNFTPLILTAVPSDDLAIRALQRGAFDFLEKPCDTKTLMEAIDSAFASRADDTMIATRATLARSKIDRLSGREIEVLTGLVDGHKNSAIGCELGISLRAVELCRSALLTKLDASNLTAAIRIAYDAGMVSPTGSWRLPGEPSPPWGSASVELSDR